jgi:5-methylcytosine-specific restriction endonuclease McrA
MYLEIPEVYLTCKIEFVIIFSGMVHFCEPSLFSNYKGLYIKGRNILGNVLVLNASFEPLSVVSVQRAIVLLLKEKAELIEAAEAVLRSEKLTLPVPLVIRLVYYVRIPYRVSLPVSRRAILVRDRYTCQYCGAQPGRPELTLDHVLPRSRGGRTTWDNVVTACKRCNGKKGNKTPAEANMKLFDQPQKPKYFAMAYVTSMEARNAWEKYIW